MKLLPRLLYLLNRLRYRLTRPVTLGVRLLLIHEGKVLLVKHTYQPEWYLPGGKVERGETVEDAARREAREEVGATLGSLRLFGVYTNFYEGRSDHILVFACDEVPLADQKNWEIERLAWFAPDALPADVSPGSQYRIAEYAAGHSTPIVTLW